MGGNIAVQWLRPWSLTREMYAQRGVPRVTQELENLGNQAKYRKLGTGIMKLQAIYVGGIRLDRKKFLRFS